VIILSSCPHLYSLSHLLWSIKEGILKNVGNQKHWKDLLWCSAGLIWLIDRWRDAEWTVSQDEAIDTGHRLQTDTHTNKIHFIHVLHDTLNFHPSSVIAVQSVFKYELYPYGMHSYEGYEITSLFNNVSRVRIYSGGKLFKKNYSCFGAFLRSEMKFSKLLVQHN